MTGSGIIGDTEILMYDGSIKQIKDVKINDEIMSLEGKVNQVKKIIKVENEMYTITQTKGITFTVSEDHILILKM